MAGIPPIEFDPGNDCNTCRFLGGPTPKRMLLRFRGLLPSGGGDDLDIDYIVQQSPFAFLPCIFNPVNSISPWALTFDLRNTAPPFTTQEIILQKSSVNMFVNKIPATCILTGTYHNLITTDPGMPGWYYSGTCTISPY